MSVYFKTGGIQTTVQDIGRFYHQANGVSPAGAMDSISLQLANMLVDNSLNEAGLELTITGPSLLFEKSNVIAITGADMSPSINGFPVTMYKAITVNPGDELNFGNLNNGIRTYIAFAGGIDLPEVLGSKSTLLRNELGGYQGRRLMAGDRIHFLNPVSKLPDMQKRQLLQQRFDTKELTLRVLLGPDEDDFSRQTLNHFFQYSSKVSDKNDRMGYRLICDPLKHLHTDGNIISEGVTFGSIQVPSDGMPIIMMADRQTTGGYTRIGSVISVDLYKLAQVSTGCKLHFVRVSVELAQNLIIRQEQYLEKINNRINMRVL